MGKIKRVLRCYNCGVVLQCNNQNLPGYIGADLLEAEDAHDRVLYCEDCFQKMKAINTGMLESDIDEELLKILKDAVATDALIIWVVDLFAFNGTLNPDVVKRLKNNKIVVIGTKYDLFRKKVEPEILANYLEERFKEVDIKPALIRIYGNTDKVDAEDMFKRINDLRQGHDVYMIGSITSGKTSIINRYLKGYTNNSKRIITTETYPGTSVKVLEIPLSNSSFFYELPGFSLNVSVLGKVEKEVRSLITPKKEIKMQRLVLDSGDAMVVGSLAAFEMIEGRISTFHFYGAENVEVKKVKNEKVDSFFRMNAVKRSLRPVSERFSSFPDYDVFEYTMEKDGQEHDISITGLGWVSFEGRGQIVRVVCPKGTAIKESLAKMGK